MHYIRLLKIVESNSRPKWKKDLRTPVFGFDNIEKYDNVGLLLPYKYGFIDFDNQEEADIARQIIDYKNLKCYEIKTERGSHFGFKIRENTSQWTDKANYYGISCDFKMGTQAESVFERIRTDCKTREIIWHGGISGDFENNIDKIDYLPKEFFKQNSKDTESFYGLADGDGRNDKLHNYQITLKKAGFSYEEMVEICNIINTFVFKDTLNKEELGVITRRTEWDNIDTRTKQKKFMIDDCVDEILNKEVVYRYGDKLLWYIDNKYTTDEDYIIPGYITSFTNNLLPAAIENIMLKLKQSRSISEITPNNDYVICKNNTIYNVLTGEVINNTQDIFSIIDYDYNYDENASDEIKESNGSVVKDFIYYCSCNRDGTFNKVKEQQLLEMIGNCLVANKSLNRCYFVKGNGANGKSKLNSLIEQITEGHSSSVYINEFDSDFKRAVMFNPSVTCNLQDDFADEYIKNLDVFKSIITGAKLVVNPKFGKSSIKRCGATLLICTNEWPKFKTEDDAINRRLMFVELENTPKKVNINLENELRADYDGQEWLFSVALKAITEAFKRGNLIETEQSKKMKDRRIVEIDDFVEYLFSEYYYDKSKLIYDDDDTICNNDYENIQLPLKSSDEIKREFYLYKGVEDIGFMMSTKKITQKIKKYCGKWYTNRDIRTANGTKKLWHRK